MSAQPQHFALSRSVIARIRLCGGMILMLYLTGHLLNLSLGLWSLALMDDWRPLFVAPWKSGIGQTLLYGALVSHALLGLVSLASRRSAEAMSAHEIAQLVLGLAIPPLLAFHILAARGAELLGGFQPSYGWFLFLYWKQAPLRGLFQVLVVSAAWMHGCLGLHTWLKLRPWWPRLAGFVYPVILLLPVAALLGFVEAGKDAIASLDSGDPAFGAMIAASAARLAAVAPTLRLIADLFLELYGAALALALAVLAIRLHRRRATARVDYLDGPIVRAPLGVSILEVSRLNDLPHASACAGHARCATCRIRVLAGAGNLSPPQPAEAELLARAGLGPDIRLACQALLIGPDARVERLVPAAEQEGAARDRRGWKADAMAADGSGP